MKNLKTPEGVQFVSVDESGAETGTEDDIETGTPDGVRALRLQPLNDFVIIFPDTGKKYMGQIHLASPTVAGIIKTKFRGLVVARGPKVEVVEKGQYVYFWKHAGSIQHIEGYEFRVCRESEILAIDLRSEDEVAQDIGDGDFHGQDRTLGERAEVAAEAAMNAMARAPKENVVDDGFG